MRRLVFICLPALCWGAFFAPTVQGAEPTALEVRAALRQAVGFFHEQVSTRGGYLWAYSGDLKLREAEGRATPAQELMPRCSETCIKIAKALREFDGEE